MHALTGRCQRCGSSNADPILDVVAVGWFEDPRGDTLRWERAGLHWFCAAHRRAPRRYNKAEISQAYYAIRQTQTSS